MKILQIHSLYNNYLDSFYLAPTNIKSKKYVEALDFLEKDFMDWGRGYVEGLTANGVEAEHIVVPDQFNGKPNLLMKLWANENISSGRNYTDLDIVVEQVKKSHPDVVLFFSWSEELFNRLKDECTYIKKYVGWIGSALFGFQLMKKLDLVLCCAPENIEKLRAMGINAVHINHAFNPKINQFLSNASKEGVSFIGQIVRGDEYHLRREKILLEIVRRVPIKIYSPSYYYGKKDMLRSFIKRSLYFGSNYLNGLSNGRFSDILMNIPKLGKVASWEKAPLYPVNFNLVRYLYPPIWGMEMFKAINNSAISLNIHADSSPIFASNMRLFEATGVGTCLLTDRKRNMNEMFEENKECVIYNNAEDCAEKIDWLLKHPLKCQEIAKAGQKRCLRDYTNRQQGEKIIKQIEKLFDGGI